MERRDRTLAGCGLALALVLPASGCRSLKSEVPPARPFSGEGSQPPSVGFSSAPGPTAGFTGLQGAGGGNGAPGVSSGAGQFGTPAPAGPNMGTPTNNAYGPPGSSSMAGSSMTAPSMPDPASNGILPALGSDPSVGVPSSGASSPVPAPADAPAAAPEAVKNSPSPNPFSPF